jgi:Fe-S-cluster-containing hydrogenase component 2
MDMLANYGYKDGSGEFFITIDTDKCDGCEKCVPACPGGCFEVTEDPHDPMREEPVAVINDDQRKKLKYVCAQCKPASQRPPLPCVEACPQDAITHSW